ncbi:MAG: type II toxin-antitoxin system RelE/ParE family toxin [Bacteroidales bacterium]|nr:type II toxin-antitoxin system RelE/ParE family toxin [Bacteroidales bacterium]
MANYFLSNKAVEDLSNIWNYTYETWSENQADKYYNILIDFCEEISKNPKVGKNYDEIDEHIRGYRASHHIIFYRIIAANVIEVVRILHQSMDLKNRMSEV